MYDRSPRTNRFLLVTLVTGFVAIVGPAWGGQVIYEDLKLLASDGAENDWFGNSIVIDDGVVTVGAPGDDANGYLSGSAYFFDASTGAQISKFFPNDGVAEARFGFSIAIDNGIVAVGASYDDDNGLGSGSAYLFEAITGTQIAKLLPSDGAPLDQFGWSIAIGNGIVAIGAYWDNDNGTNSGSAYLFDAITGAQITKLLASDGAAQDYFGCSIAIDNGIVAVGAYGDDDDFGSVYLFEAITGAQIAKLLPTDGAVGDAFGISVAIDNGVVAVGSLWDDDNGHNSGSAYLFEAITGAQIAKLLPSDGAEYDQFGSSIAIDNGIVVVGARRGHDNSGLNSGSAYLFDAITGAQIAKLLPSDGAEYDQFGHSVAIDNGVVAIGMWQDDDNGTDSGSAYVFDLCPADFNNDGIVNTLDFIAYLNAYNVGDPRADMNGDGVVNTLDFIAFLNAYNEGC